MRVTVIGKWAAAGVLVLLAAGTVFVARDTLRPLFEREPAGTGEDDLAASRRSLVYRIPQQGTVSFVLSRPSTTVRIISQANIEPGQWRGDRSWVYGYRAVLKDDDGAVVARHDVYSLALHPDRLLPFSRPVRFHRGSPMRIALQDEAVIEAPAPVAWVELSALDKAPGVVSVDARMYERTPFIGTTALSAFRRRTAGEQAEMARADAFSPALLSDAERAALMTNRWKVLGPAGIAGRDYQVEVIYERSGAGRGGGEGGEE